MSKRKFSSRISKRYRRKIIRECSDELLARFNEELDINTNEILNNSASSNHDEIIDFNCAISDKTKQNAINLSFPDLTFTNITNRNNITNISARNVSVNNISLHRENNIREDSIREERDSEEENNFKAFLV